MEWRKKGGVIAVVSLVALVLIGAVSMRSQVDSELQLTSQPEVLKPLEMWFHWRRGFGGEYQFRSNGKSVPGYVSRGIKGHLFTQPGRFRKALKVFASPSDKNLQKYGPSAPGYTKDLGVAGYCLTKKRGAVFALVELSKWNQEMNRTEYGVVTNVGGYRYLLSMGYDHPRTICYAKSLASPSDIRVYIYSRRTGFEYFQYRTTKTDELAGGFKYKGELPAILLDRPPGSGFKLLEIWYSSHLKNTMLWIPGSYKKETYDENLGPAGWCSLGPREGYTTFWRYSFVWISPYSKRKREFRGYAFLVGDDDPPYKYSRREFVCYVKKEA